MKKTFCFILIAVLVLVLSLSTLGLAGGEKEQVVLQNRKIQLVSANSNHVTDNFRLNSSSRTCPIHVPGS